MRRKRKSGLTPLTAGIVVIVAAVIITFFGFTKKVPFAHHFTIKAAFTSVNNIKKTSPVRIAGVNVGKVTSVSFLGKGQSAGVVSMSIDNEGLPIHKDATVKIRPRIFLEGNFFVDVNPGTPSAPTLGDGDTIPMQQTSDPVQLDQVLSILPTATRSDLQQLLNELSTGFSGKGGAGFNQSIPFWAPAYRSNSIVNDALLGQDQHDLSNYIKGAGVVAQATDQSPAALQGLIRDFNTTAAALSNRDTELAATIRELPNTLRVGRPALVAVNSALPHVNAFARDLLPGVRNSIPAINASIPLVRQLRLLVSKPELRGLVHDLRPTVPALTQLNVASVPLLNQTRLASSCQNTVILPWSKMTLPDPNFPAVGPVYDEGVKFLPGVGGESRSGDANGKWFRVLLVAPNFATPTVNGNFLLSANQIQGENPPKPAARPELHPEVPCETQQPPNLATAVGAPPAGQQQILPPATQSALGIVAAAQKRADTMVRAMIKSDHLQGQLRVTDTPLTAKQLSTLRAGGGK
jgi:phospholipid/cholesterol/gamma-HCH transport system substrate-binding protein